MQTDPRKKIGLFFGSFNPIHIGHLIVANHFTEYTALEEVWFVVSPQSPFKNKKELLAEDLRLEMVEIALQDYPKLKASKVEFTLAPPSYTIDTLKTLNAQFPKLDFSLIIGADNLIDFHQWKDYTQILEQYSLYVYPRPNYGISNVVKEVKAKANIEKSPLVEISATQIRKMIAEKRNYRPFLQENVFSFIQKRNLYQNQ